MRQTIEFPFQKRTSNPNPRKSKAKRKRITAYSAVVQYGAAHTVLTMDYKLMDIYGLLPSAPQPKVQHISDLFTERAQAHEAMEAIHSERKTKK